MKNLVKYILFAAVLFVASCSSSDVEETPPSPTPTPIREVEVTFTTSVQTRVQRDDVVTLLGEDDVLALFSARETDGAAEKSGPGRAECSQGVWRGVPAVMLAPEETASLCAAYPYLSDAGDPEAFPVSVAAQTDYLYSGPAVRVNFRQPTAQLTLRHALCIVAFNIRSYVGGELRQIIVENELFPLEGTMSLADGAIRVTRAGAYTCDCVKTLARTGWTADHPGFFAIPHAVDAEQTAVVLRTAEKDYLVWLPATQLTAGKKYIFEVMLTEQGAVLMPDRTEVIPLDAETDPLPDDPFGTVGVTHTNPQYGVPAFFGSSPYGFVRWGDGADDPYAEALTHQYAGSGPYTVLYEMWNAERVELSDLTGVERIDLSQF